MTCLLCCGGAAYGAKEGMDQLAKHKVGGVAEGSAQRPGMAGSLHRGRPRSPLLREGSLTMR